MNRLVDRLTPNMFTHHELLKKKKKKNNLLKKFGLLWWISQPRDYVVLVRPLFCLAVQNEEKKKTNIQGLLTFKKM